MDPMTLFISLVAAAFFSVGLAMFVFAMTSRLVESHDKTTRQLLHLVEVAVDWLAQDITASRRLRETYTELLNSLEERKTKKKGD